MVRPKDRHCADALDAALAEFDAQVRRLPGIQSVARRQSFLEQLIESIHRVRYVAVIRGRPLSPLRGDPRSDLFDPLKAAILRGREGNIEEAFWLVFIFVHFGRSARTGWRLARDIYGSLGANRAWDWLRIRADTASFRRWLAAQQSALQGGDGITRRFGNHRKYQSLDARSTNGTGAAVETYVRWVNPPRTHQELMEEARRESGNDPRQTFRHLYNSMDAVASFGRTAKFDYLTMIAKLGLARIEPDSTYMQGATGPLTGARLLFGNSSGTAPLLERWLVDLEAHLPLDFGMQVLEDSLCNWQKSPEMFIPFRG